MATVSELTAGIIAADKAGNTEDAQAFADELKAHPDYHGDDSGWAKAGYGALGKGAKLVNAVSKLTSLTPVGALTNIARRPWVARTCLRPSRLHGQVRKGNLSQLGWQGQAGEAGVDVAASLIPVSKGASMAEPLIAAGAKYLPRVLQSAATKAAPAIADIGANAAYSGGTAALEGDDASDVAKKALWAGGGAAAGRAVASTARAGARAATPSAISDDAQRLIDAGVSVTPGQAMPGSMFAHAEEAGKRLPGLAGAIESRQGELASTLVTKKADEALAHIGTQLEGDGLRMVRNADQAIDNAYEEVVPRTFGDTNEVINEVRHIRERIDTVPFLSIPQKQGILKYIDNTIMPEVSKHGTTIDGRTMRDLDIKLGAQARGYQDSINPDHWPMGNALRELQMSLRQATKGIDDTAKETMSNVNQAFRKFLPVSHAVRGSLNQGGTPTPVKLLKSMEKYNQSGKTVVDPVVDSAVNTAPKSGAGGSAPAATIGDRALQLAAAHFIPGARL